MKKFILRVIISLIVLLVIMFGIQALYQYNAEDENDTGKFRNMPEGIRIANIGNSHGLCSFNYADLEGEYRCFNFALTAQTIEYDEKILNQYIGRMAEDSVLIIPVSYVTFFLSDWDYSEADFKIKNQRYFGILDYKNMLRTERGEYIKRKYFPLIFTDMRSDMMDALADGLLKLFGLRTDGDGTGNSEMDYARDAYDAYNRHVAAFYGDGGYRFKSELVDCLYRIIAMCRENNITPVLVTTPCVQDYNELVDQEFLTQFNEILNKVTEDTKVSYYNYCDDRRFSGNYELFLNADHLNDEGAVLFTDIFYEECLKQIMGQ